MYGCRDLDNLDQKGYWFSVLWNNGKRKEAGARDEEINLAMCLGSWQRDGQHPVYSVQRCDEDSLRSQLDSARQEGFARGGIISTG